MEKQRSLTIRLTEETYQKIKKGSEARNQGLGEFVRNLIMEREIPPVVDHSREIMVHVCHPLVSKHLKM